MDVRTIGMLIVLDTDGIVNLFASPEEAEKHLEAIDIEDNEYEMCDERGQRYVGKLLSPITAMRPGTFRLEPEGWPSPPALASILGRAQSVDTTFGDYRTLDDLRRLIERPKS
jgi:hypothetical protein